MQGGLRWQPAGQPERIATRQGAPGSSGPQASAHEGVCVAVRHRVGAARVRERREGHASGAQPVAQSVGEAVVRSVDYSAVAAREGGENTKQLILSRARWWPGGEGGEGRGGKGARWVMVVEEGAWRRSEATRYLAPSPVQAHKAKWGKSLPFPLVTSLLLRMRSG